MKIYEYTLEISVKEWFNEKFLEQNIDEDLLR